MAFETHYDFHFIYIRMDNVIDAIGTMVSGHGKPCWSYVGLGPCTVQLLILLLNGLSEWISG